MTYERPAQSRTGGFGFVGVLAVGLALSLLAGCDATSASRPSGSASPTGPIRASLTPTTSIPTVSPVRTTSAAPPGGSGTNGATAAPSWLGHRVLPIGPDGFGKVSGTPPELRNRRIITADLLPAPSDGRFHSRIEAVPVAVLQRSSWSAGCPVTASALRYVTLSFRGFDGRAHTGELLLNRSAATDMVTVFGKLFAAGFPIEEMRITNAAELNAPPTGDGNDTSAFTCRPVVGQHVWSQHAYGLAVDVDPFDNPYVAGRTVLPELASYYTDRNRRLPGMITPGSLVTRAFGSVGWGWGGNFRSKKDWMHFSSTGG